MDAETIERLRAGKAITPEVADELHARLGTTPPPPSGTPNMDVTAQVADAAGSFSLPASVPDNTTAVTTPDVVAPAPTITPPGAVPALAPVIIPNSSTPPGPTQLETDTTKTTRAVYDPAKEKREETSIQLQHDAIDAETKANTAIQHEVAAGATAKATEYNKYLQAEAQKQADEKAAVDTKYKDYQVEMDKYQNDKLDSGRWFSQSSTGAKLMAGIAVGLGAIGQAYGAEGNPAVGLIEKAIDRDIAEQKFNIDQQGKVVEGKRTLYTDLVKKFGDERAARAAYQEAVFSKLSSEVDARVASSKNELIQANGMTLKADLDAKKAEKAVERSKYTVESIQKTVDAAPKAKPTEGQNKTDTLFAADYNNWNGPGRATAEKNLQRLESARETLKKHEKDAFGTSGRVTGRLPDALRSEESIRLRQDVQSAAMGSLRATLGSQFTEKEGQRVMNMSYDERLSPTENIRKIDSAIAEIKQAADLNNEKSNYYEKHGTLTGWRAGSQEGGKIVPDGSKGK